MHSSKGKPRQPKPPESAFAKVAIAAMRRAQRAAARENARYGLPLIVEGERNVRR